MRKIIIFGCGERGIKAYSDLKGKYEIVAFSDISPSKWGKSLNGIDVISPEQIPLILPSDGIVLICDSFYSKIAEILEKMDVVFYVYGDKPFEGTFIEYSVSNGFNLETINVDYYRNIEVEPRVLRMELSSKCNMKCRYCSHFGENADSNAEEELKPSRNINLSWEVLHAVVAQIKEIPTIKKAILTGRGEIFMNPEWFEMASYLLNETNIDQLDISTNGMVLTKANAIKLAKLPCTRLTLRGSVDGISPQESEYWRVGSVYETVKKNLNYAHKLLMESDIEATLLIANVNVLPPDFLSNDNQSYDEVVKYYDKSTAWLSEEFPLAQKISWDATADTIDDETVVKGTTSVLIESLRMINSCRNSFQAITIVPTGDIRSCPCGRDKFIIGNVFRDNIYDSWLNDFQLNEKRNAFRNGKPICNKCWQSRGTRHFMLTRQFKFDWEN
ncbi:MAG: radical SAM protein [Defluviitaleaceae bacterium]|nr:radical SAM protein [Defluviitaleaceae bacterium]